MTGHTFTNDTMYIKLVVVLLALLGACQDKEGHTHIRETNMIEK